MGKIKKDKVHHKFDPIGIHRNISTNSRENENDIILNSFEKSAENVMASAVKAGIENSGMEIEMIDDITKDVSSSTKTNTIENLIEQLRRANVDQLECTCSTVGDYATHVGMADRMIGAGVAVEMLACVHHENVRVSQAAIGAYRNLIIDGGSSACDCIMTTNLLTTLLDMLTEYAHSNETDINNINRLVQTVQLVSVLCEYSDRAVSVCTENKLNYSLWLWLRSKRLGIHFSIASAQCLYVITQDNSDGTADQDLDMVDQLRDLYKQDVKNADDLLLKSLCLGIVSNLTGDQSSDVIFRISEVLDEDLRPTVDSVAILMPEAGNLHQLEDKMLKDRLTMMSSVLSAQCLSMEVLANITCSADALASDMDEEWQLESENEDDYSNMEIEPTNSYQVSEEMIKSICNFNLIEKLLAKAEPLPEEVIEKLKKQQLGINIIKGVNSLRSTALLCLSNVMPLLPKQSSQATFSLVWQRCGEILTEAFKNEEAELMISSSAVLRSTIENVSESTLNSISDDDLNFLMKLMRTVDNDDLSVNAIRLVNSIGQHYATDITTVKPSLLTIAVNLIVVVTNPKNSLRVIAEALDSIFDVFSDDHLNPIFTDFPLLDKLQIFSTKLRKRIKNERKSIREHLPVIQTAQENLTHFVDYKKSVCK